MRFLIAGFLIIFLLISLFGMSAKPKYFTTSSDYHIVKKGETLQSISAKYSLPKERLKLFNDLKNEKVFVGQKLYLYPKKSKKTTFVTVRKIPKTGYHIVQPNESIQRIAKMYDISVFDILDYNDLNSYKVKSGTRLMLKPAAGETASLPSKPKEKAEQTTKKKKTAKPVSSQPKIKKNSIIAPVKGMVTSEFGIRNGRPHKGIDIAAQKGEPIHACLAGKVVYVGNQRGYGNVIILEHKNYVMSVYAHNETNFVRLGESVTQGQPIAAVGQTGTATGPHLHFEYRIKGKAINPREILPSL